MIGVMLLFFGAFLVWIGLGTGLPAWAHMTCLGAGSLMLAVFFIAALIDVADGGPHYDP